MIFWSLNLVVSIKYALFIMRADDEGQGGIFAMLALLHKKLGSNLGEVWFLAGSLVPPCFMATDLSRRLFPSFLPWRARSSHLPGQTLRDTSYLHDSDFSVQRPKSWHRSYRQVFRTGDDYLVYRYRRAGHHCHSTEPEILAAVNPYYAVQLFTRNAWLGFTLIGVVVLCVTGCEALYADMGHFGIKIYSHFLVFHCLAGFTL